MEEDVVVLNGSPEDLDLMRTKMEARQARLKTQKKLKSEAKRKGKIETEVSAAGSESSVSANGNEISGNPQLSINGDAQKLKTKLQTEKQDQKLSLNGSKLNGKLAIHSL